MGNSEFVVRNRIIEHVGNERYRVGATSINGGRPCMEDYYSVCPSLPNQPDTAFFGVFDGHSGKRTAEYASTRLVELLDTIPFSSYFSQGPRKIFLNNRFAEEKGEKNENVENGEKTKKAKKTKKTKKGRKGKKDRERDRRKRERLDMEIKKVFLKLDDEILAWKEDGEMASGSTVSCCLVTWIPEGPFVVPEGPLVVPEEPFAVPEEPSVNAEGTRGRYELMIINLGDSRTALVPLPGVRGHRIEPFCTQDHKPTDPAEKTRIKQAGGWICRDTRLNGLTAMSRALGDGESKAFFPSLRLIDHSRDPTIPRSLQMELDWDDALSVMDPETRSEKVATAHFFTPSSNSGPTSGPTSGSTGSSSGSVDKDENAHYLLRSKYALCAIPDITRFTLHAPPLLSATPNEKRLSRNRTKNIKYKETRIMEKMYADEWWLAIFSDGLYEERDDETTMESLKSIIHAHENDPASAADEFIASSVDTGSMDNMAVIMVEFCDGREYAERGSVFVPGPLPLREDSMAQYKNEQDLDRLGQNH